MPHVGIVVNTDAWKKTGTFLSIEGQVENSVKIMRRWKHDTLGFGRPNFKVRPGRTRLQTGALLEDPDSIKPGARGRDVLNVQLALQKTVYLGAHDPAVFCSETRRAFARWQRLIGFVGPDADGTPTPASLERLGLISGVFSVRPASQN